MPRRQKIKYGECRPLKNERLNFSSRHSDCHVVISHHPRSNDLLTPITTDTTYNIHTPPMQIHIPVRAPLRPVHKPLLAERFKTNLCQAFERQGRCEYQVRCMFAHGSDDLRSKDMNLLDGLVTDDAIRNFAVERYGAVAATVDPLRSILAERFKTRSCENFKRHGECSFAHRCMFAHGEEGLRTTEMNIRSGLTTEKAIKTFQSDRANTLRDADCRRKRYLKKKKTTVCAAKDARRQSDSDSVAVVSDDSFVLSAITTAPSFRSVDVSSDEASVQSETSKPIAATGSPFAVLSLATASVDSDVPTPSPRRFCHDPYAPVLLGSGATARWCGRPTSLTTQKISVTPLPATRAPAPQVRGAPFPLAVALRVLRLRQLTRAGNPEVSAPLVTLSPSRCALDSPHLVLLP
jgi:hypothetical protein